MAGPVFGAACSNPAGNEADEMYNYSYHTYQFCNGTSWRAYAGALYQQVSAGSGCTNPAGNEGNIFYNCTYHTPQFCNGTYWVPFGNGGTPSVPGYFVLSKGTYNGNFGGYSAAGGNTGLAAANAICLSEVTSNPGWKGYSTANSNGQLTAANVTA